MLYRSKTALIQQTEVYLQSVAVSNVKLRHIFDILYRNRSKFAIFGGVLRDLYLHGERAQPRDIDLVLEDKSLIEDLPLCLVDSYRKTRFGGLHIEIESVQLDLWALAETWAFRQNLVSKHDFKHLPITSFFNVESIVAVFYRDKCIELHSAGFFESMIERKLDINLEKNPFPDLCVVRALVMANQLNFSMSQKLIRYILFYSEKFSLDHFQTIQVKHYGRIVISKKHMREIFSELRMRGADFLSDRVPAVG